MKVEIEVDGELLSEAAHDAGYASPYEYASAIVADALKERKAEADPELAERGRKAAVKYLEIMGYEVLEDGSGPSGIAAMDGETLCFVEVGVSKGTEVQDEPALTPELRKERERRALAYLADHDFEDGMSMRFDRIDICVIEGSKGLLRHHQNCMGVL